MHLAFGVIFLWLGAALLWVASHGTQASTPWGVFQQITEGLKNG
jgi:hypothetical protein